MDVLALIFLIVAVLAFIVAVAAIIVAAIKKNPLAIFIAILAILLFAGALVNCIIGLANYSDGYSYYYRSRRHACSWVGMGLSIGAIVVSIVALLVAILVPKIVDTLGDSKFFVDFSQGAIRVDENAITIYRNWFPFTSVKAGRISTVIFLNDIQRIDFKGSGWFLGLMSFSFKHYNRPVKFVFGKWFVWRRMKLNKKMEPVYKYLLDEITKNNK